MRAENSLRRRLITACVLLAVIIGGSFAIAGYVIVEALEYEMIDVPVSRAADLLIQSDREGVSPPKFLDLRLAVGEQIPEEFRKLAPGHHEVIMDGRLLRVLIVAQDEQRYAVIGDMDDFERLEHLGFAALGIAFFAGI